MRLRALCQKAGLPCTGPDPEITGISCDSRTLRPGELFVAIQGSKTDGRRFIFEARAKNCSAVAGAFPEADLHLANPRRDLALLSAAWYGWPGRELTLLGVTGTNGKTTVTTLLHRLLTQLLGTKVGLLGTVENRIGETVYPAHRTTPESRDLQAWLRRMADAGCTHAVMEVSSHALALDRTAGLTFRAAGFTNLTQDHLDFHHTMEQYQKAKKRLFSQAKLSILNLDDRAGKEYAVSCSSPVLTYSLNGPADLTASRLELRPEGVSFLARIGERSSPVTLPIPGRFSAENALCALGCCLGAGIPLSAAASALAGVQGVRGRMETAAHRGPGTVVIDYAHTPDALKKVLLSLRGEGRLLCLFGCGGDRDRSKRPLMGEIAARLADLVIVTSDNPRTEDPESIIGEILAGMPHSPRILVEPDRRKAIGLGLSLLKEGDTLLLAGKGHETYQEVGDQRLPFDERTILSQYQP